MPAHCLLVVYAPLASRVVVVFNTQGVGFERWPTPGLPSESPREAKLRPMQLAALSSSSTWTTHSSTLTAAGCGFAMKLHSVASPWCVSLPLAHDWLFALWAPVTCPLRRCPLSPPCVQGLVLRAVYYMIIYALGWVKNVDSAYKTAVSTYAGIPVATIRSQTQKWFKEEVLPRTRPLARTVLERHRKQGDLCVLASSTTQFAAECAVTAYGLDDTVSSVLEVDASGSLTGNVEKLAFGRSKLIRVREWAAARNVDLSRAWFYSDSIADAPLLAEVGNPVCVNPDRRLRRLARQKGWPVVDWGHSPAPLIKRASSSNLIGQDKSAS